MELYFCIRSSAAASIDVRKTKGADTAGRANEPDALVAYAALRTEPDGKLRALEVHYLPQGAAQGQFPYDLQPDSLMTNAIVSGVSAAADGRVLRVTYKGAQAEIVVPPDAPIVAFVPGDVSLLKPGASVVISASRMSDGTLRAARVTAEKDGVKPPM